MQTKLIKILKNERKKHLCTLCRGHRRLCGKSICPILVKAKTLINLEKSLNKEKIFGASPPAIFIGTWNYPKVFAGPLLPSVSVDSKILDLPELWVDKTFNEILRYRFSLIRGKNSVNIQHSYNPDRILSNIQEIVMSNKPVDTEMWFKKKPKINMFFSPRAPPSGPSVSITNLNLAENPSIPKPVDYVVSDTDLRSGNGVIKLYSSRISQSQITRVFSAGLLGVKSKRKLVPTEWSITAVDDLLGRSIHKKVLSYPWINEFMVFGYEALANNIQILLFPSSWVFEAQETWMVSPNPIPAIDYEFTKGRTTYASELAGAYYAVRLPILEYLEKIKRQAGVLVFTEIYPEWIPLGVWRFREICRKAMKNLPLKYNTIDESLIKLKNRLRLPLEIWLNKSVILKWYKKQTKITKFFKP